MRRPLFAAILFLLTGLAGLGHQIVWMRAFAIGLGHELPSVLAVITAFFGGLALGAWLLDGRIGRSPRPGLWYAGLELVIAGWAIVVILLVPALNDLAAQWTGAEPTPWRHGLVAFALPLIGLLPATFAMGASFPAMERLVARRARQPAVVGGLYAWNTIGAMLGASASWRRRSASP
jgi:spermidine synthase